MTNRRAFAVSAWLILLAALANTGAAEQPLRPTLEETWRSFRAATKSGKEAELERTMSSFSFGTLKNNLASAGRTLTPEILQGMAEHGPDITTAEFVTVLEKGPTAALVFVKDTDEKDASGKPRVNFIVIKFVKEASGWKVDHQLMHGAYKFQDNGQKTEFDPAQLLPEAAIDGVVRSAPRPIVAPDVTAMFDVFCYGYKVELTVNGVEQAATISQSHSGLLQGGLRYGTNNVIIVVTKIEQDASSPPEVKIRRILENRKLAEVFKFVPAEKIEGKHTFALTIDK